MINLINSSSGVPAGGEPRHDISDRASVEQILNDVHRDQQAIQTTLAHSTPSMQQMLAMMDPGLIGYG